MPAWTALDKNIPILIADQTSIMRRLMKTCLKQLGFENVVEAENGASAYELLLEREFKLILADWHMPDMNGIDLLNAVRSDSRMKHVPFVFVATEKQRVDAEAALKLPATNYVIKPVTANSLQPKLEAVFSHDA